VRALDPGLGANGAAALAQRYPGPLETIFVVDGTDDPAYPVVSRLVEAGPRAWSSGKLHAMIEGMRAARLRAPLV
jgi:cellulose synthase/poly-beta-1,6-N-acetylglucosamine synthase-like glycosyltransferase